MSHRRCPAPVALTLGLLLLAGTAAGQAPAAATAPPPEKVAQARALFLKGQTAYRLGQFQEALAQFEASLKLAARASVVLNIAQCHRQLGQAREALFFYKLYLSRWAAEKPGRTSPYAQEVQGHIAALQQQAAQLSTASLALTSQPPGARIFLNGRELAQVTPATLRDLSPGDHSLELRSGDLYFRGQVTLRAGETAALAPVLSPITARVAVRSVPSGATVLLDSVPAGSAPLALMLAPGQHTLELRLPGYTPARRVVKVDGPQPLQLAVTLVQLAALSVATAPAGAALTLDGKGMGLTPLQLAVEPGPHDLRLTLAHRQPQARQLSLRPGQQLQLRAELPLLPEVQRRNTRRKVMRALGWTALSVGLVGAVGGGLLIPAGKAVEGDGEEAYRTASVQRQIDEAYEKRRLGRDLFVGGLAAASSGVACIVGAILLLNLAPEEVPLLQAAGLGPLPGGAALRMGGAF